jgi:hypothetical protein
MLVIHLRKEHSFHVLCDFIHNTKMIIKNSQPINGLYDCPLLNFSFPGWAGSPGGGGGGNMVGEASINEPSSGVYTLDDGDPGLTIWDGHFNTSLLATSGIKH